MSTRTVCKSKNLTFICVSKSTEGLLTTQFNNDETPIEASPGSAFWDFLGCTDETVSCTGTAEEWIYASFGGAFSIDNLKWYV